MQLQRSRTKSNLPIPADNIRMVALYLDVRERRALLVCCRELHWVIAPLLYRSLEVSCLPPSWEEEESSAHLPFLILTSLVQSMRPRGTLTPRCNSQHLVAFSYCSHSLEADLRAAPLLGEILRAAFRVRHLRIDVGADGVPVILKIFRRVDLIISPTSTLTALGVCHRVTLPCLESVRSSHIAIVEALMRYRSVATAVVEMSPSEANLKTFFRADPPWNANSLRRLAVGYSGNVAPVQIYRAIYASFPNIEHLELRIVGLGGHALMDVSLITPSSRYCYQLAANRSY